MGYLLDTDVCVELINGRIEPFEELIEEDVVLSTITEYELRVGMEKTRSRKAREETRKFLESVAVEDFDRAAASESAVVRAELESRGLGIGPYDTLIAGHCRCLNRILVTNNQAEFSRVPKLLLWKGGKGG